MNNNTGQTQQRIRILYTPLHKNEAGRFCDGRIIHRIVSYEECVEGEAIAKYVVLAVTPTRARGEKVSRYMVIGAQGAGQFTSDLPGVQVSERTVEQIFGKSSTIVRFWKGSGQAGVAGSYADIVISDHELTDLADVQAEVTESRETQEKNTALKNEQENTDDAFLGSAMANSYASQQDSSAPAPAVVEELPF